MQVAQQGDLAALRQQLASLQARVAAAPSPEASSAAQLQSSSAATAELRAQVKALQQQVAKLQADASGSARVKLLERQVRSPRANHPFIPPHPPLGKHARTHLKCSACLPLHDVTTYVFLIQHCEGLMRGGAQVAAQQLEQQRMAAEMARWRSVLGNLFGNFAALMGGAGDVVMPSAANPPWTAASPSEVGFLGARSLCRQHPCHTGALH